MLSSIEFRDEYLFLEHSNVKVIGKGKGGHEIVHDSWREALLSDMHFLNMMWDPSVIPNPKLIYYGNGGIEHYQLLAEMYPELEIVTYSPDKLDIPNVRCYDIDDEGLLQRWSDRRDTLLIVNRIIDTEDMGLEEEAIELKKVYDKMLWVWRNVAPSAAKILFRPQNVAATGTVWHLPVGRILLSAFCRELSNDTFLLLGEPLGENGRDLGRTTTHPMMSIDIKEYNTRLSFHDKVVRRFARFLNPLDGTDTAVEQGIIDHDYDSLYMVKAMMDYLRKRRAVVTQMGIWTLAEYFRIEKKAEGTPAVNSRQVFKVPMTRIAPAVAIDQDVIVTDPISGVIHKPDHRDDLPPKEYTFGPPEDYPQISPGLYPPPLGPRKK